MEEEPVRSRGEQCSPMTEQALVFQCALCLGHRPDGSTGSPAWDNMHFGACSREHFLLGVWWGGGQWRLPREEC